MREQKSEHTISSQYKKFLKDFFIGFYQLVQLQYLRTGSGNVGNVSAGARTPASIAAACNQAFWFACMQPEILVSDCW